MCRRSKHTDVQVCHDMEYCSYLLRKLLYWNPLPSSSSLLAFYTTSKVSFQTKHLEYTTTTNQIQLNSAGPHHHGRRHQKQVQEVLEQLIKLNQVKIQFGCSEPEKFKLYCICSDGKQKMHCLFGNITILLLRNNNHNFVFAGSWVNLPRVPI